MWCSLPAVGLYSTCLTVLRAVSGSKALQGALRLIIRVQQARFTTCACWHRPRVMSPTGVTLRSRMSIFVKCVTFHDISSDLHEMCPFRTSPIDPPDLPSVGHGRVTLSNVQDLFDPGVHPFGPILAPNEVSGPMYRGVAERGTTRMSIFVPFVDICHHFLRFPDAKWSPDTPTVHDSKLSTVDRSSSGSARLVRE